MRSSNASPVRRARAFGPTAASAGGLAIARRLAALRIVAASAASAAAAAVAVVAAVAGLAVPARAASPAVPAPKDLAALLAGFRTMPGFEARFEEEKTLALLAAPLASRGRLYFAPPNTLLRRVESPNAHDILIRDHVVRIATPEAERRRVETIDLAHRADVRPLVESMLWIFSGDLAQLESIYAIDYRVVPPATSGAWVLRLAPRRPPLSQLIRELAISGHGHGADRLEILESGGDRTTTRILDANPARRFADGEIERLFGLDAP